MDVRTPTHELTRARAVLRTRRRIAAAKPDWALSATGSGWPARPGRAGRREAGSDDRKEGKGDGGGANDAEETRTARISTRRSASSRPTRSSPPPSPQSMPPSRNPTERSPARPAAGRSGIRCSTIPTGTRTPVSTTGARGRADPRLAADAGGGDRRRRLGPDRTAAAHAVARPPARRRAAPRTRQNPWHLPCLHAGLKAIPRERRRSCDPTARLVVQFEAITAAADAGLKDHDRWLTSAPCSPANWTAAAPPQTAGAARYMLARPMPPPA